MRRQRVTPGIIKFQPYPQRIEIEDENVEYKNGKPVKQTIIDLRNSWAAMGLLEEARRAVEAHRKIAHDEWKRLDDALKETS